MHADIFEECIFEFRGNMLADFETHDTVVLSLESKWL